MSRVVWFVEEANGSPLGTFTSKAAADDWIERASARCWMPHERLAKVDWSRVRIREVEITRRRSRDDGALYDGFWSDVARGWWDPREDSLTRRGSFR